MGESYQQLITRRFSISFTGLGFIFVLQSLGLSGFGLGFLLLFTN